MSLWVESNIYPLWSDLVWPNIFVMVDISCYWTASQSSGDVCMHAKSDLLQILPAVEGRRKNLLIIGLAGDVNP